MIAFLCGVLAGKTADTAYIDCNGVGFAVGMSANSLSDLPAQGSSVRVFTYMQVREDDISLFGFTSEDERNAFEKLISVSGIGPKVALAALSSYRPGDLADALASEDVTKLSRIPGIGKKTAQRMILELKGKLASTALPPAEGLFSPPEEDKEALGKVIEDLLALGFAPAEAELACKGMPQGLDEGRALQYALKKIGGA
ncbi:MAG: Holliday junction branch migration protein RuvA [Eggerthellaceae bacterium]|nr:Holliday junction branch migration protein RuvA [Eggerthellaceae bacterium]